jgi:hypothetical protein
MKQTLPDAPITLKPASDAQTSVGRYLRDYERVKLLLRHTIDTNQISVLTGLQPSVVDAYLALVQQYHSDLLTILDVAPSGA